MQSDYDLVTIPLIDVRETGPVGLLTDHRSKAVDLLEKSKSSFGILGEIVSFVALPVGDALSLRWLKKTDNPYLGEIERIADIVNRAGIMALNLSYEWGCTSGVFAQGTGAPLLARILDWPFPGLGECTVVAHQKGAAGEFYNITWPGAVTVFQAVAPGRFAAAINQAPMRRRRTGIFLDWLRNRFHFDKQTALPPAHLLRHVFETANDYEEAKKMLTETPLSIPVIYILSGAKPGEGCVIERIETVAVVREMQDGRATAANHFESSLNGFGHGWMPRALCSHDRMACALSVDAEDVADDFAWFKSPIANPLSRLALVADAGKGSFRVMGTAGETPVTEVFRK